MKLVRVLPALLIVPCVIAIDLLPVSAQVSRGANGCGASGSWLAKITPNKPAGADFTGACNRHDACYDTLGASKEQCDNQFYNNMVSACSSTYQNGSAKFKICKKVAGGYVKAVKSNKGKAAYQAAQEAAARGQ
jgi:hypothetical protein